MPNTASYDISILTPLLRGTKGCPTQLLTAKGAQHSFLRHFGPYPIVSCNERCPTQLPTTISPYPTFPWNKSVPNTTSHCKGVLTTTSYDMSILTPLLRGTKGAQHNFPPQLVLAQVLRGKKMYPTQLLTAKGYPAQSLTIFRSYPTAPWSK